MLSDTLAFIPARGGSKGIPNKNLIDLSGKPLLHYTLSTVKELGPEVIPFVSTDSDIIADYCHGYGLSTLYRRPRKLSEDQSSIIDAILDAVEWLDKNQQYRPNHILVLQPTSPVRRTRDVKRALSIYKELGCESLVSVTKMREHPYECVEFISGNRDAWQFLREPTSEGVGRQSYPDTFYFLDGSVYLSSVNFIRQQQTMVKPGQTKLFEIDQHWAVDIDEIDDLKIAAALLEDGRRTVE